MLEILSVPFLFPGSLAHHPTVTVVSDALTSLGMDRPDTSTVRLSLTSTQMAVIPSPTIHLTRIVTRLVMVVET
uniref:Putative secreted peptide n=1 Tax=Anopheles braziliensis TaxID=58242 RepID=A0A2M3ZWI4_9DIPT